MRTDEPPAAAPVGLAAVDGGCAAGDAAALFNVSERSVRSARHVHTSGTPAALPHGEFGAMVAEMLPFGGRTARRLLAIACDERLSDRTHGSVLPASWRTLYELTRLPNGTFEKGIKAGTIRPDMTRADVKTLIPAREPREPKPWDDDDVGRELNRLCHSIEHIRDTVGGNARHVMKMVATLRSELAWLEAELENLPDG